MKALVFVLLTAVTGCVSLASNARTTFAREKSCPDDRVAIAHEAARPAPPDIAGDPGRVTMWNSREEQRVKLHYVATGCGQRQRYLCEHREMTNDSLGDCVIDTEAADPALMTVSK